MTELPSAIEGLSDEEMAEFVALAQVWQDTASRNDLRMKYYLGKNTLKDLGISVPPQLKKTETVVGWPAKSVDMLAARSMFDGFVMPGDDQDPLGLKSLLIQNQFDAAYEQAVRSQLIHCTAFWTVTKGDVAAGEPAVLIAMRSATFASALWDHRKRRIRSGMAVIDTTRDAPHAPTMITLYLDHAVITSARNNGTSTWSVIDRQPNPLGRPNMEPMPFLPDFFRPFGRSRITREVMSITDSAQRAALRAEVLMEFNTAPQKFLLGADDDAFKRGHWDAYLSTIKGISKDEDGDTPNVLQLPQLTPDGAISYMQHLATRFAGATGVPVASLGVVQDNPSSAEAIMAAKDDLVTVAHTLNRTNQIALANVARMVTALRDGVALAELPEGSLALQARFRNPAMPSVVSQSDAMVKQISAIPWLAETDVALEELGYDESQITRLMDARRRAAPSPTLDRIIGDAPPATQDPAELKSKFEALGLAIRAGVDPQEAASRLGLDGIGFTGAVPVSLRMPESQAGGLEEK